MTQISEVNWHDLVEALPAFLTLFMIPFTYSIANGTLIGIGAALLLYLTTGQFFRDILEYSGRKHSGESGLVELEAPSRSRQSSSSTISGVSMSGLDQANDEIEYNSVFVKST